MDLLHSLCNQNTDRRLESASLSGIAANVSNVEFCETHNQLQDPTRLETLCHIADVQGKVKPATNGLLRPE